MKMTRNSIFGSFFAFAALVSLAVPETAIAGGLQCPRMARMCKDGSAATTLPNSCKQVCPEDSNRPGNPTPGKPALVCPEIARICKDGSTANHAPNSCKLICPEDKPGVVGSPSKPIGGGVGNRPGVVGGKPGVSGGNVGNRPGFVGGSVGGNVDGLKCPKIARMCKDGSAAKHAPNSCKLICPEDNGGTSCTKMMPDCMGELESKPGPDGCPIYTCKPALMCTQVVRMCKDGSVAKRAANSCDQLCPEDNTACKVPDCAAPPAGCSYDSANAPKDKNGCATSCGPMRCEGAPATSGSGTVSPAL